MVLLGRIELPTSSLPMTRSTTELQQHFDCLATLRRLRRGGRKPEAQSRFYGLELFIPNVSGKLHQKIWRVTPVFVYAGGIMSNKQKQDKLDKRAAALRENLSKRKPVKKKPAEKKKD